MLATLADPPLAGEHLVYEPKYDGIRTLVDLAPGPDGRSVVTLWSRLGNVKTAQFPDLVRELERLGRKARVPLLLDGEIAALDPRGEPASFQYLQGRMHLTGARDIEQAAARQPVAFIVFDILRDDGDDVRGLPLTERRRRLAARLAGSTTATIRIGDQVAGDGHDLERRARDAGWEGLIVKEAASVYESGRRSMAWRKLKLTKQQEFVIGGWSDPRHSRAHFGALLLGVHENGRLIYVGHTGSGFTGAELSRVAKLLAARAIDTCPFAGRPPSNERPHWVRPDLVAEVKFTEWTMDGRLRHPIYLGLREDVDPRSVKREEPVKARAAASGSGGGKARARTNALADPALDVLVDTLQGLERSRKDGYLLLPDGQRLRVTNLAKVFWPALGITKGELFRYYARVSPFLLPAVADRPMVMKRFPNGITGDAFYQQRAREAPPAGVRIEVLPENVEPIKDPSEQDRRRVIGGSLLTLLWMTQIAAISQDPWFSRVQSAAHADYVAIDLDPMEGVPFATVLDVARWVRDELQRLGVPGVPKTSGSRGLHIYIPLPPRTTYESGMLFCQLVATIVADKHPKHATVTRAVSDRGRTVYVDYLQNILGKTLATAYSVRASEFAGVSTPLEWSEVDEGVDPCDFTIRSVLDRFEQVGDLWARLRTAPPADLRRALTYVEARATRAGRKR
jgi:bifunctional non-homologous end joining protein LigD